MAEVVPRFFFEVVDAPVGVALPRQCRMVGDPLGCVAGVVVVVVAGIENYFEDSGEWFASSSESEIAGLLVFGCQFEAHEGSHSLLKMFWCTGQRSCSGQPGEWEDLACFSPKASLIV